MELNLIGTSLSAVDQVNQAQQKSRKRQWTIAFSFATLLALYQSANIASMYFHSSMNVMETQVIDDENPSVTMCDNNHTPYINDTDNYDYPITREEKLMEKLSSECDPWKATLFCLSLLSERERFSLGFQPKKMFYKQYFFNEYSRVESSFNNLYYGNCVTFSTTDRMLGIKFKLAMPLDHTLIMVIHEKGTLPVFNKQNIIYVDNYDFQATYSITKVKLEHQHWPFNSVCEEFGDSDYLTYPDLNDFKFKYSYESCLDQCVYELTKDHCNCVQPMSMLEINTERLPICKQWCNQIPDDLLDKMCNCKVPCQSLKLSFKPQFASTDVSSNIVHDIIQNVDFFSAIPENHSLTIEEIVNVQQKDANFGVDKLAKVLIYNHRSAIISEASSKSIIDVLSAVGGIWGLWIGLSVSVLISMPSASNNCQQGVLKKITTRNNIRNICSVIRYLALTIITGIAGWQICITISDYYRYKVIQVSTTEDSDVSTFPALFLCSQTHVHFSPTVLNDANLSDVVQFFNDTKHLKYNAELANQKLGYYYEMTKAKKILVLPRIEDLITTCQYQLIASPMVNCTPSFHAIEDHELMRACVAINPPTDQNVQIQEMQIQLKFPFDEFSVYELATTLSFHPFFMLTYAQARNRLSLNFINAIAGDFIDIKYNVKQIRRLKSPYVTKCIEKTSNYTFWPSGAYANLPPKSFFYNYEV